MDEKKRNRQSEASSEQRNEAPAEQSGEMQNVSNEESLSQGPESGENFYQNRERGNYDPNRAPEEGGGTLY